MELRTLNPAEDYLQKEAGDLLHFIRSALDAREPLALAVGGGVGERMAFLPAPLVRAIQEMIEQVSRGNGVVIASLNRLLTTTEAAEVLGVSRPYLARLLDDGEIDCEYVGTHRRVSLTDLLAYRARKEQRQDEAIGEFVDFANELGL